VRYKNVAQCEVRYYELDVEFAFSAQPFAGQNGTTAAFVQPNLRETKDLPQAQGELTFALPAQFATEERARRGARRRLAARVTFFATRSPCASSNRTARSPSPKPGNSTPLPKTYVKVFAKLPSASALPQGRLHRPARTLRLRVGVRRPQRGRRALRVLVLDEQRGAVIREVAPPVK
jgi:hypothetical protein